MLKSLEWPVCSPLVMLSKSLALSFHRNISNIYQIADIFSLRGSVWRQLSNFEALTGRNPAILDCYDCEQTLCQLSNIIQGNSVTLSSL